MATRAEWIEKALDLISIGTPIQRVCDACGINETTFYRYAQSHPDFRAEYMRAKDYGTDFLEDKLLLLIDELPDVQKARLQSDNIKWVLSKRKPSVYGDRVDVNLNATVDLAGALTDAKNRVSLPRLYPKNTVDAELVEPPKQIESNQSASEAETQAITVDAPTEKHGDHSS